LTHHPDPESAKKKNIIDMAIGFTAMMRNFSEGSKAKIEETLEDFVGNLVNINTRDEYEACHRKFCVWFADEIVTAEKKLKNGAVQPSQAASYGHGAKVLDIAIKVCVYYCSQPNVETARRIEPLLNGAIDTPILKELKSIYTTTPIPAKTIQEVDEETYRVLQSLVLRESLSLNVHPVQYDDIKWRQLNR